jgi:hypothetical protein
VEILTNMIFRKTKYIFSRFIIYFYFLKTELKREKRSAVFSEKSSILEVIFAFLYKGIIF